MNDTQSMGGALSHARSAQAEEMGNLDHGWNEWTDKSGRIWFYDIGQPPRPGNRAGYSWDLAGGKDAPPAIRVWDAAVERHGVEQAAIDAVRLCVFKGLPEPLKLHGTAEFQKFAAREMFRLNIELANADGPGWAEYDRLHKAKFEETEKARLAQVNSISSAFSAIDNQASRQASLHRAAEMEDTPSKKDDDDRMRMRGPRQ